MSIQEVLDSHILKCNHQERQSTFSQWEPNFHNCQLANSDGLITLTNLPTNILQYLNYELPSVIVWGKVFFACLTPPGAIFFDIPMHTPFVWRIIMLTVSWAPACAFITKSLHSIKVIHYLKFHANPSLCFFYTFSLYFYS